MASPLLAQTTARSATEQRVSAHARKATAREDRRTVVEDGLELGPCADRGCLRQASRGELEAEDVPGERGLNDAASGRVQGTSVATSSEDAELKGDLLGAVEAVDAAATGRLVSVRCSAAPRGERCGRTWSGTRPAAF